MYQFIVKYLVLAKSRNGQDTKLHGWNGWDFPIKLGEIEETLECSHVNTKLQLSRRELTIVFANINHMESLHCVNTAKFHGVKNSKYQCE